MDTDDILKMARELGEAISVMPLVDEIRAAQGQLLMNHEAYELLNRYQEARVIMQHKMNDGLYISEMEETNLKKLDDELKANPVVKSLIDAQSKLDDLMQGVYYSINQAISGDNACSSDCGTCGGGCEM